MNSRTAARRQIPGQPGPEEQARAEEHARADAPPASEALPSAASPIAADSQQLDVLFVLNNLGIGGSERKILRLLDRLSGRDLRAGIVCLNGPYTLEPSVPQHVPLFKLQRSGKLSPAAAWRLRQLVVRHRPDTLVAVNLYPALYVAFATGLARQHPPRTIGLVNTSTFGQGAWRRSFYRLLLPRLGGTVHGSLAQRALWFSDGSSAWRRSTVIYNGVDLDQFRASADGEQGRALRARAGIPPQRFVIGSVGRLAPEKNQESLLRALATLRSGGIDAHVLLVGDGPLRERLEQRAAALGVATRTTLLGAVTDVRPALAAMDVFVLPSVAVECFSNAALEAMAMSKAVILSDIGGAREMVRDRVEGFVIARSELDARLPALLAALCADTRRRTQLGEAARRRVASAFSLESMVEGYRNLLRPRAGEESNV